MSHRLLVDFRGFDDPIAMNSHTSSSRGELEFAEAALREALARGFGDDANADARSLGRMLVHLVKMNQAISVSPDSHANVAKRLADFAVTTTRMARRNPDAAAKLTRLSEALRVTGVRMSDRLPPKILEPHKRAGDSRAPLQSVPPSRGNGIHGRFRPDALPLREVLQQ